MKTKVMVVVSLVMLNGISQAKTKVTVLDIGLPKGSVVIRDNIIEGVSDDSHYIKFRYNNKEILTFGHSAFGGFVARECLPQCPGKEIIFWTPGQGEDEAHLTPHYYKIVVYVFDGMVEEYLEVFTEMSRKKYDPDGRDMGNPNSRTVTELLKKTINVFQEKIRLALLMFEVKDSNAVELIKKVMAIEYQLLGGNQSGHPNFATQPWTVQPVSQSGKWAIFRGKVTSPKGWEDDSPEGLFLFRKEKNLWKYLARFWDFPIEEIVVNQHFLQRIGLDKSAARQLGFKKISENESWFYGPFSYLAK